MPGRAAGTRTIALVGPGGAGKTSLAEALLFASGAAGRQGSVADGSSIGDASPDALAEALRTILADPARARAMGAAGQRRATVEFSPERSVAIVEAVYHRLVSA